MRTIPSEQAAPKDFDTWMRDFGPKKDTPAPKPADKPIVDPYTPQRGKWGDDVIPEPARGGSWEFMDGEQMGMNEDALIYPTTEGNWSIGVLRNEDGEHCWGYLTPDGDLIDENGQLLEGNGHGAMGQKGPGWEQFVERHQVEEWFRKQGVADTDMPTEDDWHTIAL